MELGKSLVKVIVVGLVAYWAIEDVIAESPTLVESDPIGGDGVSRAVRHTASVSRPDWPFWSWRWWTTSTSASSTKKNCRMSKEEVKEETKSTEGDPMVKGRIRSIQRRIAYRRMMQDVPKADVIVTNPTHLAVALKYDADEMRAPRVVAKGADLIALKIREIAAAHDVPIVEDKPLAQALYPFGRDRSGDPGEDVPGGGTIAGVHLPAQAGNTHSSDELSVWQQQRYRHRSAGAWKAPMRMMNANSDVVLAVSVIFIIALLIVPIPAILLDVLLAANITIAIVILMVSMYLTNPLEISVFPGLLLILTIFRLGLNVASTRLILGEAYAGEVITAFGSFVVKGNYVVGFIIFLILVLIQFVVIVKGAGRIAEVAARFTLDGMPGKQMAIDADLNAGMITEKDARERRREISREAEFYGAMDGASKFVKGDAIAGLLINIVNILGGFVIGVAQRGMTFHGCAPDLHAADGR